MSQKETKEGVSGASNKGRRTGGANNGKPTLQLQFCYENKQVSLVVAFNKLANFETLLRQLFQFDQNAVILGFVKLTSEGFFVFVHFSIDILSHFYFFFSNELRRRRTFYSF